MINIIKDLVRVGGESKVGGKLQQHKISTLLKSLTSLIDSLDARPPAGPIQSTTVIVTP